MATRRFAFALIVILVSPIFALAQSQPPAIILRAARMLDVENGKIVAPAAILIQGERIAGVGPGVSAPAGAQVIDLGDVTLMPGLIDAHVHLFLHPGAEDLQTVEESVPQRTILATLAAKADLMAGFTAERDMGTEGAGSADTAVRNAINDGLIPGPRLRISGNAVDILGGHEDANHFNPAQNVLSNADRANNSQEIVAVIREQVKEGSDFVKMYETGRDTLLMASAAHAVSIHRSAVGCRGRRAARTGRRVARARYRRAGHALCRAGRRGVCRSRRSAQRRNHAPDAGEENSAVPTFAIVRILCRSCA